MASRAFDLDKGDHTNAYDTTDDPTDPTFVPTPAPLKPWTPTPGSVAETHEALSTTSGTKFQLTYYDVSLRPSGDRDQTTIRGCDGKVLTHASYAWRDDAVMQGTARYTDANGNVTATTVTDNGGHVRKVTYDANGNLTGDTRDVGTTLQRSIAITPDAATQLPASVDDGLGRKVNTFYDATGQPTSATYGVGTTQASSTLATYTNTVNVDQFEFGFSVLILSMVIVGGMGNIWGVILGAIALSMMNRYGLKQLNGVPDKFGLDFDVTSINFGIFGFFLLVMMVLRPEGFLPSTRRKLELHEAEIEEEIVAGEEYENQKPVIE